MFNFVILLINKNMETKTIYQKLAEAREFIITQNLEKKGFNEYSKYNYYTPEQVNHLVSLAEKQTGLFHKFDLMYIKIDKISIFFSKLRGNSMLIYIKPLSKVGI
jgi:hypothetical protein